MAEKTSTLPTDLWELANAIVGKVREHRDQGALVSVRSWRIKPVVGSFEYKEGSISIQTSFQDVEKEEWHWKDQHEFIEKAIKPLHAYTTPLSKIVEKYSINSDQADFLLTQFARVLSGKATEPVSNGFLVDQITIFVNQLEKAPVDWEVVVWLSGLWLEEDKYQLGAAILLRRPEPADFEVERGTNISLLSSPFGFDQLPSAILEMKLRGREGVDIQRQVEAVLNVLRLYRTGSVTELRLLMNPKSFSLWGGSVSGGRYRAGLYKYPFKRSDINPFMDLLERLKDKLPTPFTEAGNSRPLEIAFQRFQEALLQPVSLESRITSAITCMEALYLKATERMELSHRLGQRAALLLGLFGRKAPEIYNNLDRAYNVRSVFIHGSQVEESQRQSLSKMGETVIEYARLSLLIFFQLEQSLNKERLLNKVDNSLLDHEALNKLREAVTKDILVC